jgi:hypothetical protein
MEINEDAPIKTSKLITFVDTSRKYLFGLRRHVLYGRSESKICSIVCNISICKYESIKTARKKLALCDSHLLSTAPLKFVWYISEMKVIIFLLQNVG